MVSQQDDKYILKGFVSFLVVIVICVTLVIKIDPQDNVAIVSGNSVYNIVSNYLELCKGRAIPYGGSINARKEDLYDYDRARNFPGITCNNTA